MEDHTAPRIAQEAVPRNRFMNCGDDLARGPTYRDSASCVNGIIRTDPSSSGTPNRSEKRMSKRASRRSMVSREKLSIRRLQLEVALAQESGATLAKMRPFHDEVFNVGNGPSHDRAFSRSQWRTRSGLGTSRKAALAKQLVRQDDIQQHLTAARRRCCDEPHFPATTR